LTASKFQAKPHLDHSRSKYRHIFFSKIPYLGKFHAANEAVD